MTPEELSERHPLLYHVTEPGAAAQIRKHGLLSTSAILDLMEVSGSERQRLEEQRRQAAVSLHHPRHGTIVLNDQLPLSEKALANCLDDGLRPADWLKILNARVFFWTDEEGLGRMLGARMNRGRKREVLVVKALNLVQAHAERVELCPINSGATIRKPARRGLQTFTPMTALGYEAWRRKRGGRDRILELVVRHGVADIADHIAEVRVY